MYSSEETIRNFMKKLTVMDIANSVHFYGVDFETCEISEIFNCVYSLFCDIKSTERMVKNNFQSEDGEKVLLPSSRESQEVVIQDYYRKCDVLNKVLECGEIADMLRERIVDDVLEKQSTRTNS